MGEVLKFFILILTFLISSIVIGQPDDPEPKDPGELGKKTLIGIDSDADGVRDDVEIWINKVTINKPSRDMYNLRGALKQIAKRIKENMIRKDDPSSSQSYQKEVISSFRCLRDVSTSENEYEDLKGGLQVEYFNTMERMKADNKLQSLMRGQIMQGWHGLRKRSSCDFKLKN